MLSVTVWKLEVQNEDVGRAGLPAQGSRGSRSSLTCGRISPASAPVSAWLSPLRQCPLLFLQKHFSWILGLPQCSMTSRDLTLMHMRLQRLYL